MPEQRQERAVKLEITEPSLSGMKITDAETGIPIRGVCELTLHWKVHELPTLTLTTVMVQADIESKAELIPVCPQCRKELEDFRKELEDLPRA